MTSKADQYDRLADAVSRYAKASREEDACAQRAFPRSGKHDPGAVAEFNKAKDRAREARAAMVGLAGPLLQADLTKGGQ